MSGTTLSGSLPDEAKGPPGMNEETGSAKKQETRC